MEVDAEFNRSYTTGKIKRQRKQLHIPAKSKIITEEEHFIADTAPLLPLSPPKENLFAGLDINISKLKKSLTTDDIQSVKSYKSLKSESGKPIIPKKEKITMRRKLLLKKIDAVNQMKKQLKIRQKRKNITLIGDTNPLHDALPSLESLLKNKSNVKCKQPKNTKTKGIEKATQRKKKLVDGVKLFKQTLKNKNFKKNPFEAISCHIKAVVEEERKNKG